MPRKSAMGPLLGKLDKKAEGLSNPRKAFCDLLKKGYVIAWHDESDCIVIRAPKNYPKMRKATAIMFQEKLGINSRKALEAVKGECQRARGSL